MLYFMRMAVFHADDEALVVVDCSVMGQGHTVSSGNGISGMAATRAGAGTSI
jgi:hypothetical protein